MAKLQIQFDPARSAQYHAAGFWNDETLRDWLARHAAARGERIALRLGDAVWTYAQVAVESFATALRPHNPGCLTLVLKIAGIYLVAVTVAT